MNNLKVTIIGAGEIGRALGKILQNKSKLTFWDKNPKKVKKQQDLIETTKNADFIFLCVNTGNIREAISKIESHINKKSIIITLAKGLEEKTGKTAPQIIAEFVPINRIAVIGGPMIAEEIQKGLPSFGIVGTKTKRVFYQMSDLFMGSTLHLQYSANMEATSLLGALKNIYSIAQGIADGLNWGFNQRGALISASVTEMALILKSLGFKQDLTFSIAGLGDLIATGESPNSLNKKVGLQLVKKVKITKLSEGLIALPILSKKIKNKTKLPIFSALINIVTKNQSTQKNFNNLEGIL